MEEIQLNAQVRKEVGTRQVKRARRANGVPGIVYGGKQKPTTITLDRKEFDRIRRQHRGEGIIFHLNILDAKEKVKDYTAMILEEQHDPVSDLVLHVDFKRISLKEKITVKVPIVALGEPIGVKRDNGSLEHALWELDVNCLPTQIPKQIEIEVTPLVIGDSVHVRDIKLPEGVTTKHDPDAVVFLVVPPMKEEVVAEEPAATEPEVTKEKKEPAGEKKAEEPKAAKEEKKPTK
jgi:large subunit ribosomal protein L25